MALPDGSAAFVRTTTLIVLVASLIETFILIYPTSLAEQSQRIVWLRA